MGDAAVFADTMIQRRRSPTLASSLPPSITGAIMLRRESDGRPELLIERPADIKRLTDFMLGAWPEAAKIDRERIGLFGFSRGGYTGLVVIGGNPDFRAGLAYMCPPERRSESVSKSERTRLRSDPSSMMRASRLRSSWTQSTRSYLPATG
jgi:predicted dienelactone hydrolase